MNRGKEKMIPVRRGLGGRLRVDDPTRAGLVLDRRRDRPHLGQGLRGQACRGVDRSAGWKGHDERHGMIGPGLLRARRSRNKHGRQCHGSEGGATEKSVDHEISLVIDRSRIRAERATLTRIFRQVRHRRFAFQEERVFPACGKTPASSIRRPCSNKPKADILKSEYREHQINSTIAN